MEPCVKCHVSCATCQRLLAAGEAEGRIQEETAEDLLNEGR